MGIAQENKMHRAVPMAIDGFQGSDKPEPLMAEERQVSLSMRSCTHSVKFPLTPCKYRPDHCLRLFRYTAKDIPQNHLVPVLIPSPPFCPCFRVTAGKFEVALQLLKCAAFWIPSQQFLTIS